MGQSIFDKIQAKLELFRLEQRYTRRRNRRSTFVSNAIYVDGEYVYQTPNTTGSSADSASPAPRINALHGEKFSTVQRTMPVRSVTLDDLPEHHDDTVSSDGNGSSPAVIPTADRKRLNRFSSMPGFGGSFGGAKEMPSIKQSRRTSFIR